MLVEGYACRSLRVVMVLYMDGQAYIASQVYITVMIARMHICYDPAFF